MEAQLLHEIDEHDLYPVHEEDSVPVVPDHFWRNSYLATAIQSARPDLWAVGDVCLYWERGNTRKYLAPDVAVIDCPPPAETKNVYLQWIDPPLLFVLELGSKSTFKRDTGAKLETYEQSLKAPEYLYADPPKGILQLWRLDAGRYLAVMADELRRVWSEELGLGFGYDVNGFLRVYTADGQEILTYDEEAERAQFEARRAESEAQRADEEAQRAESEARRADEEARRAESEARRADEEARRRLAAEQQLAELQAELERLRPRADRA